MKTTNLVLSLLIIFGLALSTSLTAANQVVTSTANSGAETLRQAIADVGDGESIAFNISGSDVVVISSELSITTKGMNINGYNNATGNNITVQVTTPGTTASRVFHINASGKTFNFSNMTIKGGDVSNNSGEGTWGGGIFFEAGTLNLNTVTISGSKAIHGGGMFSKNTSLTLTNCTISGNSTVTNTYGYGGGMRNYGGSPTLINCTISGNTAKQGGGVFSDGSSSYPTLTNCTISGNNGTSGGGGIYNYSGTLTITNCTVSGNTNVGIYNNSSSNIYIKNTIIANNTSHDFSKNSNASSVVFDNGYNIVEDCYNYVFSATGDITGEQAGLNLRSTLADNGSSNGTKTLALYSGSVAIDAGGDASTGANNGVAIPTTDQRGAERYDFTLVANVQSSTDIGAYEDWPDGDGTLPVELTSFTAIQKNNSVILEWQTSSEIDNLGFIIERKEANNEFIEIVNYANNEELKGAGNTSVRSDYIFTDNNVVSGVTYEYRISDADYSGKVKILKTITINITENATDIPKIYALNSAYPNPFNPTTTISYDLPKSSFVTISVYDITGKLVENLINENKEAGSYSIKWNASNISSGIYLYRLVINDFVSTKKLIFLK